MFWTPKKQNGSQGCHSKGAILKGITPIGNWPKVTNNGLAKAVMGYGIDECYCVKHICEST